MMKFLEILYHIKYEMGKQIIAWQLKINKIVQIFGLLLEYYHQFELKPQ